MILLPHISKPPLMILGLAMNSSSGLEQAEEQEDSSEHVEDSKDISAHANER